MLKTLRILSFLCVPCLTLVLGWQIGVRQAQEGVPGRYFERSSTSSSSSVAPLQDPSVVPLEKQVDIGLMWETWGVLLQTYYKADTLNSQDMVYGAVRGMVESLKDPYTVFMTPEESGEFHEALSGDLQGIGAELEERDGQIVVVSPLKGSPAEAAGLLPEDVIVAVNGNETAGLTLRDVVERIRGEKGTKVTLTVVRASGSSTDITVTRDEIHIPSVESKVIETDEGPVGYIALNQFADRSTPEIDSALRELLKENVTGLLLDLRSNGGGYLEGAVEIASYFLPKGKNIVTVEHGDDSRERHTTAVKPLVPDLPLVVLVNQGSASAAEILAGALQDEGRATLVGTQTYGKGSVQEVIELPGGASIRVTTARWLTPSGRDIGHEGIAPDLVVDRTQEDMVAERDPQLDAALRALKSPVPVRPLAGSGTGSLRP